MLVDAVANIKIGSDDLSIATASEQLLHDDTAQIRALAKDVPEGNMREIIGQMTIAELAQNRDKFAQESIKAAMSDMSNIGLDIINLTTACRRSGYHDVTGHDPIELHRMNIEEALWRKK